MTNIIRKAKQVFEQGIQKAKDINYMLEEKGIKDALKSPIATHAYALIAGALMAWGLVNNAEANRFEDREENALYKLHHEYVEHSTGKVVKAEDFNADSLNRAYFDPNSYPKINWTNDSNQKVGMTFGEICAKEIAMAIDSFNNGMSTPGKKYKLDYNYCNIAVTTAVQDAVKRSGLKTRGKIEIFDDEAVKAGVLYNGDSLVQYFTEHYNQVPGAIIQNPTAEDFAKIAPGSIVRLDGHSKMFMGFGFVDSAHKVFVPNAHGKPVIASGYDESFKYFEGDNCTVVDLSKVTAYKLKSETGRHTR